MAFYYEAQHISFPASPYVEKMEVIIITTYGLVIVHLR